MDGGLLTALLMGDVQYGNSFFPLTYRLWTHVFTILVGRIYAVYFLFQTPMSDFGIWNFFVEIQQKVNKKFGKVKIKA